MTLRAYGPAKRISTERMEMIHAANAIITEYQAQGFSLTLRQLYYQFVARGLLPNNLKEYGRLGDVVSDGRMAGLIDWTAIEDRTRSLRGNTYWRSPSEAVQSVREGYQIDKWARQPWRPEVWVEKEALLGVIEPVCTELGVDYFGCRGYNSQSEQWRAGMRFASYYTKGQRPIVFHLGDHDPSGLDMTRDNTDRLSVFAGTPVQVVRLALNMKQVEELRPPPNPAKTTDARYADYARRYGEESWELDALSPTYIANLIRSNVVKLRDERLWSEALAEEAVQQQMLDDALEVLP